MTSRLSPKGPRLVAVGDIMLGRDVSYTDHSDALSLVRSIYDEHFCSAAILTGNLECLITDASVKSPLAHQCFKTSPNFALPLLQKFDVLNLANNHAFDYLDRGIEDTILALDQAGVAHVGIGKSESEAIDPTVIRTPNGSVAIFGMTGVSNAPHDCEHVFAKPNEVAFDRIAEAVSHVDHVVVHMHAGGGDVPYPSPDTRAIHKRLRSLGVRTVLGHHPHVMQGWILENEAVSFFSLGDFLFDRFEDGRSHSLVAHVDLSTLGDSICTIVVERMKDMSISEVNRSEPAVYEHLAELNRSLMTGVSDRLYFEALSTNMREHILESLAKDMRAGGFRAIVRRISRLTPAKAGRLARVGLAWLVRKLRLQ